MLIDKRIHAFAAAREVSARYVANDLPRPLPFGLHAKKIGASGHGRECAIGQKKSTGVASNCRQHLSGTNGSNPPPSSGESGELGRMEPKWVYPKRDPIFLAGFAPDVGEAGQD
jgi:hypothetical protein